MNQFFFYFGLLNVIKSYDTVVFYDNRYGLRRGKMFSETVHKYRANDILNFNLSNFFPIQFCNNRSPPTFVTRHELQPMVIERR